MRAGPLSDTRVISLLNRFFVPVYVSNEDFRASGTAPADEKAEYQRIYRETLNAHLSAGTVHVYLLKPDGHVLDSMHVAQAADASRLVPMLERAVETLKPPSGPPPVRPAAQSAAPKAPPGALVLHLTARALSDGSWHEFPSENWLVLDRSRWTKLLPTGTVRPGTSWEIDPEEAARLLTYFYPQTENNDVATNRIEEQSLIARIVSVQGGVARARIDGRLKMKHAFYPHREDGQMVTAQIVGGLDFTTGGRRIRSLKIVTDGATYGKVPFGVAVRSLP
jgi:hypothetical protein